MEIRDYLDILWRRKWVIFATVLVTEIVVIVAAFVTTPTYTASVMLRIATSATGTTINYSDYMYADRLINTYVKLSTTKPVLDELVQRLGLDSLPQTNVEILPQTELIKIEVEHRDPIMAANIANTLSEILMSQSIELYSGSGESSQVILQEQLTLMEEELNQAREEYMNLVAQNPDDTVNIQSANQNVGVVD